MRKASLDLCRVLACLAVVLGHTGMLFWDFDPTAPAWAVYNLLFVILRSSVLLFFMVSGAIFLSREKLDFARHLKRAGHMLALFYIWSLILNGIDALFLHYWTPGEAFVPLVLRGYFHLWFLPAMAMSYCALPLLHGMLHGNRENICRGAVLLALIVCMQATLKALPDKAEWLAALVKPYDFSYFRYFVMMPLGYVLWREKLSDKGLGLLGLAALLSALIIAWLNRRYSIRIGAASDALYEDLAVSSGLTAAFVFCLCKRVETLPKAPGGFVKLFSACSFGVYLMHPVFIDTVRSRHFDLTRYSALWLYPLSYLCFLLLPMGITWVMLKLPGLRKLVT
jgi:surface polysaccharide O-acyltransferase-like enzyme